MRGSKTSALACTKWFVSLSTVLLGAGSAVADNGDLLVGAPEVPIVDSSHPAAPTPTPVLPPPSCTDPALPLPDGSCPQGSVHIREYTGIPDSRCIPNAPDYPLRPSNYNPDCSDNDHDVCAPCVWHKPACTIVTKTLLQDLDTSYHNMAFIPFQLAAYVTGGAPSCMQSLVGTAYNLAWAKCTPHPEYCDDVVRALLAELLGVDPRHLGDHMVCNRTGGGAHYNGVCVAGEIFVDQSCRALPVSTVHAWGCSDAAVGLVSNLWGSSPISLEWRSDRPVESISSVVTFPVDPAKSHRWYLWRGSADSPLLVYDPAQSGKISSGAQLFGNWTFGGKRTASLSPQPSGRNEWQNGFEALATLDTNHDGFITGTERAPLALWFDRNQDGVAQAGEVVSLADRGVTKIAVRGAREDAIHGVVSIKSGYEREENGSVITGRAVDWFAKEHSEPAALYFDWSFAQPVPAALAQSGAGAPNVVSTTAAIAAPQVRSALNGVWKWTFEGRGEQSTAQRGAAPQSSAARLEGSLMLSETVGGTVLGYSFAEAQLQPSRSQPLSVIRFAALEGSVAELSGGERALRFELLNPSGRKTRTEAVLSRDGQHLTGRTHDSDTDRQGTTRTFDYRWTAVRVVTPSAGN